MRLKKVAGQVAGIQRMVEEDRYCVDVLHQVAAVEGALDRVGHLLLTTHVETCVVNAFESGKPRERQQKLDELMEVFSRFGRVRPWANWGGRFSIRSAECSSIPMGLVGSKPREASSTSVPTNALLGSRRVRRHSSIRRLRNELQHQSPRRVATHVRWIPRSYGTSLVRVRSAEWRSSPWILRKRRTPNSST